jgi:uncharacterized protein with HEPN domain
MTADAAIRNLEIIGEAAKRLPEEVRSGCPEIPWREIIGLCNFVIHEYFGIKMDVIWDTVQNELPVLELAVTRLLSE